MRKLVFKYFIFVFFFFVLFSFENVSAKQEQQQLCLGENGLYTITWDSELYPSFDPNALPGDFYKWKEEDFEKWWHETGHQEEYIKIDLAKTASSCYQASDGSYNSCPTYEDKSVPFTLLTQFVDNADGTFKYENIEMILDENTYKYNIKIKDLFDGKMVIRYVRDENTKNGYLNMNDPEIQKYADEFITSKDGYFTIKGVKPSTGVDIEVYVKNSSTSACNGSFVGGSTFYTYNLTDEEVNNPAYSNPSKYYCDVVKQDKKIDSEYKQKYIYECYSKTINYSEIDGLYNTIKGKYEKAYEIYSSFPEIIANDVNSLNCVNGSTSTAKQTIKLSGEYWSLNCYENFLIDPDEPKLTHAGGGFNYETRYTVSRTCSLTQIKQVEKKPKCETKEWCQVEHWDNIISWEAHPTLGGPNEDFDQCVSECDGGRYTQSCINSCYNEVYGTNNPNRKLSVTNSKVEPIPLLSNQKIKPKIQQTGITFRGRVDRSDLKPLNTGFYGENTLGQTQWYTSYEITIDGFYCQVHLGPWCSEATTLTTVAAYSSYGPDGCSEDPDGDYAKEIAKSKEEFNKFKTIQTSYENIQAGEYKIQIQDSYLKDENGKSYIYEVSSENNPKATVDVKQSGSDKSTPVTNKLGNSSNDSVTYAQIVERSKTFTVNLPVAYASKNSGQVVYASKGDTKNAFQVNLNTSKTFNKLSKFSVNDFYNGGYKYYTSIWSNNINVDTSGEEVVLQKVPDFPNNIKVIASGVGTVEGNTKSNFNSNMSCYYGVYNQYYEKEDGEGIQYIYRTIDLENMFPNRDARYNWTGTIKNNTATGAAIVQKDSMYDDSVDPETLITEIEAKGETIYDVSKDSSEVDYEFVLTTENIRNIRKYNKNVRDYNGDGSSNYLDYNMSCYTNSKGQEVCTSRFLDNINGNSGTEESSNFVTYSVSGFGITSRKSIAGCNNAIGGTECDNIGK